MADFRTVREKTLGFSRAQLVFETRADGRMISAETIRKFEFGIPITRQSAMALIRTLNRLTGQSYIREDFPALRIIDEEQTTEDDHSLAAVS